MTGKELVPFDFRNSGATNDTVGVLKTWIRKTAEIFQERLSQISMAPVKVVFHQVLSRTFENEVSEIDPDSLGFEIEIEETSESTLAYINCLDLVAIVSCLLGNNKSKEQEESRRLTSIEASMGQMIIESFALALREGWPGDHRMGLVSKQNIEAPHRSRMMPMDSVVLRIEILVEVDIAKGKIVWLVQRGNMEPMLRMLLGSAGVENNTDPRGLVEMLELELIAILGEVEVEMRELSDINVGDLLCLNQKITSPIQIDICGTPGFRVWPGRLGRQQVVQVIDLV